MYALYKELHPPTVVEHCCSCNFFSGKEKNLVVAGTTQLRVFRLIEVVEVCLFLKAIILCIDIINALNMLSEYLKRPMQMRS